MTVRVGERAAMLYDQVLLCRRGALAAVRRRLGKRNRSCGDSWLAMQAMLTHLARLHRRQRLQAKPGEKWRGTARHPSLRAVGLPG
jgi:hypothetical protein